MDLSNILIGIMKFNCNHLLVLTFVQVFSLFENGLYSRSHILILVIIDIDIGDYWITDAYPD